MKPWHIIISKTVSHNSKFWFHSWLHVWKTIFSHTLFSIFFLHYSFTLIQSSNFQLLPHQTVSLTVLSPSLIPIIIFFIFFYLLFIFFTSFVLERYRDSSWKKRKNVGECACSRVECHTPRPQESDTGATILPPHPCFLSLVFNQIQAIVMLKGGHFFIPNQWRSKTECIIWNWEYF